MTKSRKFGAFTVIVFLLTAISGVSRVWAQVEDDKNGNPKVFSAGAIAGANFCQVDGDNFAGYYKVGLNVGGIVYAKVRKNTALSMEILYSQKGAKSRYGRFGDLDSAIYINKYSTNLNYAEIPVMINFFDVRRSHAGIGLSYGRLINSTETVSSDPVYTRDLNKDYPFKKSDFQLIAGAQLHLWKGLFMNLRVQYSLVPIRTNLPPGISRSSQYNNMWTFRLMYLFI